MHSRSNIYMGQFTLSFEQQKINLVGTKYSRGTGAQMAEWHNGKNAGLPIHDEKENEYRNAYSVPSTTEGVHLPKYTSCSDNISQVFLATVTLKLY